jgi:poly(ADP-ribose) glycohydrolase ARH3
VLQRIAPLLGKDPDPARVAAETGNDVTAIGSVPAAVAAFLRTPDSPTAAVRFAINLGGDADTIAARPGRCAGRGSASGMCPRRGCGGCNARN